MFASLSASAKQDAEVLGVAFGSTCEETVQKLSKDYGTPKTQSADKLVYLNEMFEGFKADRVELGFQEVQGTTKLNQARFYFVCPSKAAAIAKMKSLAKKMKPTILFLMMRKMVAQLSIREVVLHWALAVCLRFSFLLIRENGLASCVMVNSSINRFL